MASARVSNLENQIHIYQQQGLINVVLATRARTDDDVLSELAREHVRLAHLRVGHAARDEYEHPLARFRNRSARARRAVPAGLGAP